MSWRYRNRGQVIEHLDVNQYGQYLDGLAAQIASRYGSSTTLYADQVRQEDTSNGLIARFGYGTSGAPTWALDVNKTAVTMLSPIFGGTGPFYHLNYWRSLVDADGCWDAPMASAIAALAATGGVLYINPGTYTFKNRIDAIRLEGVSIIAGQPATTRTSGATRGVRFEPYRGTGQTLSGASPAQAFLNLAGSTQVLISGIQIGRSDTYADIGAPHTWNGSAWVANGSYQPTHVPKCAVFVGGAGSGDSVFSSGAESANFVFHNCYVSGYWQVAAQYLYGVANVKLIGTQVYNYAPAGHGLSIDAVNSGSISSASSGLGGVTINSGYAQTFSVELMAGSQCHSEYYNSGHAGHVTGYALHINRAQHILLSRVDAVSSNYPIGIADTGVVGDPSGHITMIDVEPHNASVYGPETTGGSAGHANAEAYGAINLGAGTVLKALTILGLRTDASQCVINFGEGAQITGAFVRNVRAWKYTVPIIRTTNATPANAVLLSDIDCGGMQIVLDDAHIDNVTRLWNTNATPTTTSGTTSNGALMQRSTGGLQITAASTTVPGLTVIQQLNGTAISVSAPSGYDAINASGGNITVATGSLSISASGGVSLVTDSNRNVQVGVGNPATNSTNGFLYIPSMNGVPSGTPTSKSGYAAVVYDQSSAKIMVYQGAWRGVVVA